MNFRKWVNLFMSSAGIGIVVALIVGVIEMLIHPEVKLAEMGTQGIIYNLVNTAIIGALLGVFSHMGFFAYLTVNYFAQGIFRSKYMWMYVQIFIIIVSTVYSVALRVPEGESFLPYTVVPLFVIVGSLPVVFMKVKQTNRKSLIPTLFFMIAVTLIEAVPALRQDNGYGTAMMLLPLFICNAWQILQLHKLVVPSAKEETATSAS